MCTYEPIVLSPFTYDPIILSPFTYEPIVLSPFTVINTYPSCCNHHISVTGTHLVVDNV